MGVVRPFTGSEDVSYNCGRFLFWNHPYYQMCLFCNGWVCVLHKFQISESWSYPPLADTANAAKKVHEALAARGWKLKV